MIWGSKLPSGKHAPLSIKFTWREIGRTSVEASVLNGCNNKYGNVQFLFSLPLCTKDGVPMSNHLFLPEGAQLFNFKMPWVHGSDFVGLRIDECEKVTLVQFLRGILDALLGQYGVFDNDCRKTY